MPFAERLRMRREALHLSQNELARISGVGQAQISQYEAGERQPRADSIIALARTLSVSSDWLLGLTDVWGDGLSEAEVEILRLFREKSPQRQPNIIEIVRLS